MRCRPRCELLEDRRLPSITLQFDYSLDTNHFFDTQAKKDILELAGHTIAARLLDQLSAIVPDPTAPPPGRTWSASFLNPATGENITLSNLVVPANTVIVYVGGRALTGSELGNGGGSGGDLQGDRSWFENVIGRGQSGVTAPPFTDYAPAVVNLAFDTSANWYFGAAEAGLGIDQFDFLSVAEHELGHALGIGTANSWKALVQNGTFLGPKTDALFNGPVPTDLAGAHFAQGTFSGADETAMEPATLIGKRKNFTAMDFAALDDLGWEVAPSDSIAVTPDSLFISKNGVNGSFAINLTSIPTDTVTIPLESSNVGAGTLSASQLVFTPADALVSQTVTVIAHDDGAHSDTLFNIVVGKAVSSDVRFAGQDPADITIIDRVPPPPPSPPASNPTTSTPTSTPASTATVSKSPASVTLHASRDTAVRGQPITFEVEVSGAGTTPTGTVTLLGLRKPVTLTLQGGKAEFTGALPLGRFTIHADYSGDLQFGSGSAAGLVEKVVSFALQPDPRHRGKKMLVVGTTAGKDRIRLQLAGRVTLSIDISQLTQGSFHARTAFPLASISAIQVYGRAGQDQIQRIGRVKVPVTFVPPGPLAE